MNVLLVFSYGSSLRQWDENGIISREISLYNKLQEKGVNFNFLTFGDKKDLEYSSLINNFNIIPILDIIKSKNPFLKLLKTIFLIIRLKKILKNIDLIKTNQVSGSWIAILAKVFYKKKILIRSGYEWFRNYMSKFKTQGTQNYFKFFLNYIYIFITEFIAYNLADKIIMTNKSDIEYIIKTFKLKNKRDRIRFFSNFIDVNLFKPKNIEKKDKHILFIGRLSFEKNLFNLLEGIKNLKNFTLDIIGKGPCEKKLKIKAKEQQIKVNFLGVIANNNIPGIINQYQIFILPSFYECNPKALLEAMSCGVPCVGTNVRGINKIINHKENGYLCGTSSKSISEAIKTLYDNKSLRKKISENARNYIMNCCSLDFLVENEFLLYNEIINEYYSNLNVNL